MRNVIFTLAAIALSATQLIAGDMPPVQIDRQGITFAEGVKILTDEFGIPIRTMGMPTKNTFNLVIDETSLPRTIAAFCEQASASPSEAMASEPIYLRPTLRPPLVRYDFETGEILLITTIRRSREMSLDKPNNNLQLSGAVLTEGGQKVFGVSTFMQLARIKVDGKWQDVESEPTQVQGYANQLAWNAVGMWRVPDVKSITAIDARLQIKRVIERLDIDVPSPADVSLPPVEKAGVTIRREQPNAAAKEVAVIIASGKVVSDTAKSLEHKKARRFALAFDANDRPSTAEIEAEFASNGDMIVRIKSKNAKSVDHVRLWWPTKIEESTLTAVIDPLPTK